MSPTEVSSLKPNRHGGFFDIHPMQISEQHWPKTHRKLGLQLSPDLFPPHLPKRNSTYAVPLATLLRSVQHVTRDMGKLVGAF